MSRCLRKKIESYLSLDDVEVGAKEDFLQFIDTYGENIWARDNLVGHIVVSAWVVNKDRTKVVMAHHNLYNSWAWLGGHADGNKDTLYVAKKEVAEECGAKDVKILLEDIFDINIMNVGEHLRRGKKVPAHSHYNVTYLLEADDSLDLVVCERENSGVKWIRNEDVMNCVNEEHMKPIYERLMRKVRSEYE